MAENHDREVANIHAEPPPGDDTDRELPAAHPERRGLLDGLAELAGRLGSQLAPIEPPPAFVAGLKQQHTAMAARARAVAQRKRREKRQAAIAAGAGGAVYLLGIAALAVRAGLSVAGLVAAVLRRRRLGSRDDTVTEAR
jgi:hypothetical protein